MARKSRQQVGAEPRRLKDMNRHAPFPCQSPYRGVVYPVDQVALKRGRAEVCEFRRLGEEAQIEFKLRNVPGVRQNGAFYEDDAGRVENHGVNPPSPDSQQAKLDFREALHGKLVGNPTDSDPLHGPGVRPADGEPFGHKASLRTGPRALSGFHVGFLLTGRRRRVTG